MWRVDRADDSCVQIWVCTCEAENELHQVRQRAGGADKTHFPFLLELEESIERALLLQVCRVGEGWNLDDVEMVDFHPRKALFHTRHDVLADENCGPRWP